jgi:hypothetical protein
MHAVIPSTIGEGCVDQFDKRSGFWMSLDLVEFLSTIRSISCGPFESPLQSGCIIPKQYNV